MTFPLRKERDMKIDRRILSYSMVAVLEEADFILFFFPANFCGAA